MYHGRPPCRTCARPPVELDPSNELAFAAWNLAGAWREIVEEDDGTTRRRRPGRLNLEAVLRVLEFHGGDAEDFEKLLLLETHFGPGVTPPAEDAEEEAGA